MAENINLSGHFNDGITPKLRVLKSALGEVNKQHQNLVSVQGKLTNTMAGIGAITRNLTGGFERQAKSLRGASLAFRGFSADMGGVKGAAHGVWGAVNKVTSSVNKLEGNMQRAGRTMRTFKKTAAGVHSMGGLANFRPLNLGMGFGGYGRPPGGPTSRLTPPPVNPNNQNNMSAAQWRHHWAHAGGTFGHTLGQTAGEVMRGIFYGIFRMGVNILGGGLKGMMWALKDGIQDEMSDIQSAGGMFAVDKKNKKEDRLFTNFTQARMFQEETNRSLAHSAARLPGTTAEYVKAAKRITDSIMLAKVNNPEEFRALAEKRGAEVRGDKNAQAREDITTLLTKFTEQAVLLGLGSTGRGTLSMDMILEQLVTREQVSMGQMIRYAPLRDNPVLTSILTENKDLINQTKARSAQRLEVVMDVLEKALPREVINSMRNSIEGVSEVYRSFLIDQDIGIFGLRRELNLVVASTNTYGQFIDEQGNVVNSLSEAAKKQTRVFDLLRDTIAGFGVPLAELMPLILQLWDPLEKLGGMFVDLRRTALVFQQRFTAYTNWFKNRDYENSSMRGALAALNKLLYDFGGVEEEVAFDRAKMLEVKGEEELDISKLANMFQTLIDEFFNSPIAEEIGRMISTFVGSVFVTMGEMLHGTLDALAGDSSKEKSPFVKGLLEGWQNLTSDIFDGAGSAASQAIMYIFGKLKEALFTIVITLFTEFPKETMQVVFFVALIPALVAMVGTLIAAVGTTVVKFIGGMGFAKMAAMAGVKWAGAAGTGALAAGAKVGTLGATGATVGTLGALKAILVGALTTLAPILTVVGLIAGIIYGLHHVAKNWEHYGTSMSVSFELVGLKFAKFGDQIKLWLDRLDLVFYTALDAFFETIPVISSQKWVKDGVERAEWRVEGRELKLLNSADPLYDEKLQKVREENNDNPVKLGNIMRTSLREDQLAGFNTLAETLQQTKSGALDTVLRGLNIEQFDREGSRFEGATGDEFLDFVKTGDISDIVHALRYTVGDENLGKILQALTHQQFKDVQYDFYDRTMGLEGEKRVAEISNEYKNLGTQKEYKTAAQANLEKLQAKIATSEELLKAGTLPKEGAVQLAQMLSVEKALENEAMKQFASVYEIDKQLWDLEARRDQETRGGQVLTPEQEAEYAAEIRRLNSLRAQALGGTHTFSDQVKQLLEGGRTPLQITGGVVPRDPQFAGTVKLGAGYEEIFKKYGIENPDLQLGGEFFEINKEGTLVPTASLIENFERMGWNEGESDEFMQAASYMLSAPSSVGGEAVAPVVQSSETISPESFTSGRHKGKAASKNQRGESQIGIPENAPPVDANENAGIVAVTEALNTTTEALNQASKNLSDPRIGETLTEATQAITETTETFKEFLEETKPEDLEKIKTVNITEPATVNIKEPLKITVEVKEVNITDPLTANATVNTLSITESVNALVDTINLVSGSIDSKKLPTPPGKGGEETGSNTPTGRGTNHQPGGEEEGIFKAPIIIPGSKGIPTATEQNGETGNWLTRAAKELTGSIIGGVLGSGAAHAADLTPVEEIPESSITIHGESIQALVNATYRADNFIPPSAPDQPPTPSDKGTGSNTTNTSTVQMTNKFYVNGSNAEEMAEKIAQILMQKKDELTYADING